MSPKSSVAPMSFEEFLAVRKEYEAYSQRFGSAPAPASRKAPPAPGSEPRSIAPEALAERAKILQESTSPKNLAPDWQKGGGRPVKIEDYTPEWRELIKLYGNLESLGAAIGCSGSTIWKWNKKLSRPSASLTEAVRKLAKGHKIKSPL